MLSLRGMEIEVRDMDWIQFCVEYKGRLVGYCLPDGYTPGCLLVDGGDAPLGFASRRDEIITWGAICACVGDALIRALGYFSFGRPDTERECHDLWHDAAGIVEWHLRQEDIPFQQGEVYQAIEDAAKEIRVLPVPQRAPKRGLLAAVFGS